MRIVYSVNDGLIRLQTIDPNKYFPSWAYKDTIVRRTCSILHGKGKTDETYVFLLFSWCHFLIALVILNLEIFLYFENSLIQYLKMVLVVIRADLETLT